MTDFFILAGGYGKRAAPLSDHLPKPLFPLDGEPLLKRLSDQLRSNGFIKGYINIHHLAPLIRNFNIPGLDITCLEEKVLTGNRILSECGDKTESDLLVINGDTYLDIPFDALLGPMAGGSADGIILVRKKDGPYSSIVTSGDRFIKRDKDPRVTDLMYAGVSVFRNGFLPLLREENLFDSLENAAGSILITEYKGEWLDIGTPENYFLSNERFRKLMGKQRGNSFSPGVSVSADAAVTGSIVWDNTLISGTTVISDCIVTGGLEITGGTYHNSVVTADGESPLCFHPPFTG